MIKVSPSPLFAVFLSVKHCRCKKGLKHDKDESLTLEGLMDVFKMLQEKYYEEYKVRNSPLQDVFFDSEIFLNFTGRVGQLVLVIPCFKGNWG